MLRTKPQNRSTALRTIAFAVGMLAYCTSTFADTGRTMFAAPEEAAKALIAAIKTGKEADLLGILGPSLKEWINSGDDVADRQARGNFATAYEQKQSISMPEPGKAVLVIGNDDFPFPIPMVKAGNKWAFDPDLGKQEIIDRRVGRNELATIQALLAVADAQSEYAALERDRHGAPQPQYARKFMSSPGKKDGLYWASAEGAPQSPLGPLAAQAARVGYTPRAEGAGPAPFNGYYFRMLFKQGSSASGGVYSYLVKDRMIGGFAVVAWPVSYGVSGYKTFMVSHDRMVFEADLGPSTAQVVSAINSFDPGKGWSKVDAR